MRLFPPCSPYAVGSMDKTFLLKLLAEVPAEALAEEPVELLPLRGMAVVVHLRFPKLHLRPPYRLRWREGFGGVRHFSWRTCCPLAVRWIWTFVWCRL